ncbi:hypothetical protein PG994_007842 [Apiospora phragmitis]|uniref:Rhodopsin domain-containing protein n=1 Tax=Apiospora phragmitis TaxID=2905665 RepID=A0ABR1UTS5_9PEZI
MDFSSTKNPELFSTESRAAAVIVGVTALLLTPSVAVALRFYTRRVLTGRVSYDDWITLVALNLGFAYGITIAYMTRVGLGHHIGTITQSQSIKEYIKAFYLSVVFYNTGIMFVKLSFLSMYYRAMKAPRWRKVVAHGEESTSHVKCIPYLPEWYQNTAGNIALNGIILLLSIPMIRSMKLPGVQKFALAAIFYLGVLFLGLYVDTTFDNVDAAMWSLCEISAGVLQLPASRIAGAQSTRRQNDTSSASLAPAAHMVRSRVSQAWFIYGVALEGGKTAARTFTTELSEDGYHEVQQQVLAADSPKAHYMRAQATTRPQRPTLSRLTSFSSLRRHSSPEGPADSTEIIIIGLQCVRSSKDPDRADGGSGGVQQPGEVYRGWRNSETGSFGPQHGP